MGKNTFREALRALLNYHSMEGRSDTPDFIMANFMLGCLDAFDLATRGRDEWYGYDPGSHFPNRQLRGTDAVQP